MKMNTKPDQLFIYYVKKKCNQYIRTYLENCEGLQIFNRAVFTSYVIFKTYTSILLNCNPENLKVRYLIILQLLKKHYIDVYE